MLTLRLNELSVDYTGSTMNRGRRRRRTTTITTTTTIVPKKIITARSYQNSNLDGCKRTNRKRRQGWESKNPPLFISSFAGKGGFASEDEEGKRRREQARDLVRNLLDASFLSSNTNGCKLIPCDRPPSSLLTGSLQLTYRERSVPDVENSFMHKCQLVSSTSSSPPMARRFRCRKANKYIAHLFFQISKLVSICFMDTCSKTKTSLAFYFTQKSTVASTRIRSIWIWGTVKLRAMLNMTQNKWKREILYG